MLNVKEDSIWIMAIVLKGEYLTANIMKQVRYAKHAKTNIIFKMECVCRVSILMIVKNIVLQILNLAFFVETTNIISTSPIRAVPLLMLIIV